MSTVDHNINIRKVWSWFPSDHEAARALNWSDVTWTTYQLQVSAEAHRQTPPGQVVLHRLSLVLRAIDILHLPKTLAGAKEAAEHIFELRRKHADRDLQITPDDWKDAVAHHSRNGGAADVMMFAAAGLLKLTTEDGQHKRIVPADGGVDSWELE